MPSKSKRGGAKAAAAAKRSSSATMQAWLSGSKNTASATNPSENAMEVDEIVDQTMVSSETEPKNPTMSEQGPNVSNSKNAAPGESTTTSNLYDPLLDDLDLDDISAKLEQAQARAAKAVAGDAQISSRTHRRKASKSSYNVAQVDREIDEEEELLNEVLGISKPSSYPTTKRTGRRPASKLPCLRVIEEPRLPQLSSSKSDVLDRLIELNNADEAYSAKLESVLHQIEANQDAPISAAIHKSRIARVDTADPEEFQHETTYLVPYFTTAPPAPLPGALSLESWSQPTPSLLPDTPENQEIFKQFCAQPNSILKLPFLRALLLRRICPVQVADWLVHIMTTSKHAETAYDAYDILLSLLPAPTNGWPARICTVGQLSPVQKGRSNLPFVWTHNRVESMFNLFGAGRLASLIHSTGEKTLLKHSMDSFKLEQAHAGENIVKILESVENEMPNEITATVLAVAQAQAEQAHVCAHFNAYNFSLLSLFWAACLQIGYVDMTLSELTTMIIGVYRAMVDPSCQSIVPDLQVLVIALFEYIPNLLSSHDQFPSALHDVCEGLWAQLPAPKNDFHSTLFRWTYLTPCSSDLLKTVRPAMAYHFMRRMTLDESQESLSPPPPITPYKLGTQFVQIEYVCEWLNATMLPKHVDEKFWRMWCSLVLLIGIATACFDIRTLMGRKSKNLLQKWEAAFGQFHKQGKERGDFKLSITRFKDLATHIFTTMRLISNSIPSLPKKGIEVHFSQAPTTPSASVLANQT